MRFCVSVRWVTLWVRPPPVKICVSVRWVTMWVRSPPQVPILKTVPARAYTTLVVLVCMHASLTWNTISQMKYFNHIEDFKLTPRLSL